MSFLVLAMMSALPAGAPQDATIPVEAYLLLKEIEEVRGQPGGQAVVMSVTERDAPRESKRRTLYLWSPGSGSRRLAADLHQAWEPRWSPDGERVGFLATRAPQADGDPGSPSQLWVIEPGRAGGPVSLASLPGEVRDFAWAGNSIVIALGGAPGSTASGTAAPKDSSTVLWKIPVGGGAAELVWSGSGIASQLAVAPDGRSVILVHSAGGSPPGAFRESDLWLHTLDGSEPRRLTRRPGAERYPAWSPDGTTVTFQAPQQPDHPNSQTELFSVPAAGGNPRPLTTAFDRPVLDHLWTPDGRLVFRAALGAHTHLFAIEAGGAIAALTRGPLNYGAFSYLAEDSSIVAVREGAAEPQELWRVAESGPGQLTRINERAGRWNAPRQEVIRWTAPDGLVVEGLLVYPRGFSEGQSYPLLVEPAGGWGRRVRDVLQQDRPYSLLSARGYAVLAVNVRGSIGYGESFATANRRDLGGGEVADIISGIAFLSRQGIADTNRLGIIGEGYGREITEQLLESGQRFRAAAILVDTARRSGAGSGSSGRAAARVPLLTLEESSGSEFQRFFRLLRWFDRFIKFDGADRVAFRLPDEPSAGPEGWSLRVEGTDPVTHVFTLQPGGTRFINVTVAFSHAAPADAQSPFVELDLDGVVLDAFGAGDIRLAGTVTRFFGYPTLLLPLGSLAVSPETDGGGTALTIDLAFPIGDESGEYLLRVAGFEPVRVWVPPAGT